MTQPLAWMSEELAELERDGLRRRRRVVVPRASGRSQIDGRDVWNFASNDYLGLARDPRVIQAAQAAAEESGVGATASALVTGRSLWHARLEAKLAEFEDAEAAILFPTGYAANLGVISAVVGRSDAVFSDRLNHASLIDGCRLSRAAVTLYDRDRLDELARALPAASSARRRLIVTDSLFSMDGDVAPLADLCDLAEAHDAMLMVDEAHATGVYGDRGRGIAEQAGVEDRIPLRVGTLSKGIGASGGFVTGSDALIHWIWNRARTQIFSTALPPPICAAAMAALDIIATEPGRREELLARSARVHAAVREMGLDTIETATGPVIPVMLNDPDSAMRAARELEERGYLVGAIRPPTVPAGTSRLRITLSWVHDDEAVDGLLKTLRAVLHDAKR